MPIRRNWLISCYKKTNPDLGNIKEKRDTERWLSKTIIKLKTRYSEEEDLVYNRIEETGKEMQSVGQQRASKTRWQKEQRR